MLHVVWNVVEVRWVARTVVVLRSPRTICRRLEEQVSLFKYLH